MQRKSSLTRFSIQHVATAALLLSFGVAGIHAQPGQVDMTVSGTAAAATISLRPDAVATSEYQLAGNGTFGQFDLRVISASIVVPQPPSSCSAQNNIYGSAAAGGSVFRFRDGSLLTVSLTGGSDCIDTSAGQAVCIRIFQITGGTGRLKNASGNLTLTMTVAPMLGDASNNPVLFTVTGTVTGMLSGGATGQENQERQP